MACARTPREHKHNHEAGRGPCSHAASTNTTRGTMWSLCVRAHISSRSKLDLSKAIYTTQQSLPELVEARRAPAGEIEQWPQQSSSNEDFESSVSRGSINGFSRSASSSSVINWKTASGSFSRGNRTVASTESCREKQSNSGLCSSSSNEAIEQRFNRNNRSAASTETFESQ